MDIKGLKLNRKLICLLNKSIETINEENFQGIDAFRNFTWKGFDRNEFKNLLDLFVFLDYELKCFKNFSEEQTFIFNYSTDIAEFDIVTVAEKDNRPIFIDIELKNNLDEEKLKKKLLKQLANRINSHLPQLIKNDSFLTLGFINNRFIYAYYFDGTILKEFSSVDELISIFDSFKGYNKVEDYLIQTSNIASIIEICNGIKKGNYRFYDSTNKKCKQLINEIDKNDVSIIYGDAGTGKSILALKIFFECENSKILMVNSKLYHALDLNKKYYLQNRATFNSENFLKLIDKNTISIVDECQRISIEKMADIIKKSKMTYLFGDNKQSCFKEYTLLDHEKLKIKLEKDYGFKVSSTRLRKVRRYSDDVNKILGFLTSISPIIKNERLPPEYDIKLFYDEHKFLEHYKSLKGIKKIYVPINQASDKKMTIDNEEFTKADNRDDYFSVLSDSSNCYGTTYHALSFDIDHCFVYLSNIHLVNLDKKQVMYYKDSYSNEEKNDINLFLNELNILFTRGRKSLNIYLNDINTYLYLNLLLSKLK